MTERPDFLSRIVDRTLERVPVIEPRELSRFEARRAQTMEPEDFSAGEEAMRNPAPQRPVDSGQGARHEVKREPPRLAPLNQQHDLSRATAEAAPVGSGEIPGSKGQDQAPPLQPRESLHRDSEDTRPALVAWAPAARFAEVPEHTSPKPVRAEVDGAREPPFGRREQREPREEAVRPGRDLTIPSPPSRPEGLLPKQSLVQSIVMQPAGSSLQSPAPAFDSGPVADTVVNVTVGRVEVRASAPSQKPAPAATSANRHQPMSLTEYLTKRGTAR